MSLTTFLAQGGGGGGGGQWMQLIGFLVVVGLSALSWAIQKLNEQREKKRRQDLVERRALETLRTGREEPETQPSAAAPTTNRQQELAAKRQAQLEELRRRAQERARQQQPGPVATRVESPRPTAIPAAGKPGRISHIPGSSGPIVVAPRRPERAQPKRPAPTQVPKRPSKRTQPNAPRVESSRGSPAPGPAAPMASASTSHGLLSDINTRTPAAQIAAAKGPATDLGEQLPRTQDEWRRALVMREILSPPLALREPGDHLLG